MCELKRVLNYTVLYYELVVNSDCYYVRLWRKEQAYARRGCFGLFIDFLFY